jgi:hypothetical protein
VYPVKVTGADGLKIPRLLWHPKVTTVLKTVNIDRFLIIFLFQLF